MVCRVSLQLDLIHVEGGILGYYPSPHDSGCPLSAGGLFRNFEGTRKQHSSAQVELARADVVTW